MSSSSFSESSSNINQKNGINPTKPHEYDPLLVVSGLSKFMTNGKPVLNDLSFSLQKNQIVAIVGPSGVGKTTLLKCISQLVEYNSGSISLFAGNAIYPDTKGISYWRSEVMYVPQRMPLLEGTPLDFYNKISSLFHQSLRSQDSDNCQQSPIKTAQQWGIEPLKWSQKWSQLSGGEIQRISLATSISCNPKVLLLDEPTSMLDTTSALLVENTLKERGGIIIVTHNTDQQIRISDYTLELLPRAMYKFGPTSIPEVNDLI
ncbi:Phosphate import ATP-binding protein PstB 1 [Smittium culicis]|uniref:Phosphate import ATP-binding protein PstB 1 n=1 Tax=Smittium culicis TaxID=133412 RepID=A0A1R1X1N4_9FUNG|nr:Phosphate import ATP-binding protein PstB 1 [Smittium culicis]